jgi:hypothetical protein
MLSLHGRCVERNPFDPHAKLDSLFLRSSAFLIENLVPWSNRAIGVAALKRELCNYGEASVTGHPVTCTAVVVLQWLVGRIEGVCEDLGLRRVD